ncbi:MAG: flagellar biosynthesis anti-sigma factor FlgM [Polyangiaceae bacterium]|jgi:flagellar biosynthesis anti-sigma factor FlgM
MRINDRYAALGADAAQNAAARNKVGTSGAGAAGATSAEAQSAVTVTVSAKARELADAQQASGGSDVDEAKVARLQQAVSSGTLDVDSTKIAQRIVNGD